MNAILIENFIKGRYAIGIEPFLLLDKILLLNYMTQNINDIKTEIFDTLATNNEYSY